MCIVESIASITLLKRMLVVKIVGYRIMVIMISKLYGVVVGGAHVHLNVDNF